MEGWVTLGEWISFCHRPVDDGLGRLLWKFRHCLQGGHDLREAVTQVTCVQRAGFVLGDGVVT